MIYSLYCTNTQENQSYDEKLEDWIGCLDRVVFYGE